MTGQSVSDDPQRFTAGTAAPSAATTSQQGDDDRTRSVGVAAPFDTTSSHLTGETPIRSAGVVSTSPCPTDADTPTVVVPSGGDLSGPQATDVAVSKISSPADQPLLGVPQPVVEQSMPDTHSQVSGDFKVLSVLAASFDDAQNVRIRIENRLRSGTIPPELAESILTSQAETERMIGTAMRKQFKRAAPEIHAWVKATPGLGEHLMARLIGTIGHPVIATPHHWEGTGSDRVLVPDPPFRRNVAKLWAYCGHGDPTRKRRKGMTAEDAFALGNPMAKKLVYLLATSAMKVTGGSSAADQRSFDAPARPVRRRSPYRDTYELARARYEEREGWTPGHQHAAALRLVGKEILKDLWVVANATV